MKQGDLALPVIKNGNFVANQAKTGLAALKAAFKDDMFSEEDNIVEKTWQVHTCTCTAVYMKDLSLLIYMFRLLEPWNQRSNFPYSRRHWGESQPNG